MIIDTYIYSKYPRCDCQTLMRTAISNNFSELWSRPGSTLVERSPVTVLNAVAPALIGVLRLWHMQKSPDDNNPSKTSPGRRSRRITWLVIILASMVLYFPINRLVHGGVELSLLVDRYLPLYPPFVIPYLLGTLLFVVLPVWAAVCARSGEFEEYAITLLLATGVSYLVYLVFPTYITRPGINSQDIFSSALVLLYKTDQIYNAVPSGHAFYSTLSMLYLMRWKPGYKLLWMAGWLLILASTLLTGQHHIPDLIAGLALASVVYPIGGYIRRRWRLEFAS
jgi:membrane-associated phospholipid phosphatase